MRISADGTLRVLAEMGDHDAAEFLGEDAWAWSDGLPPGTTVDALFEMGRPYVASDVGWREDFCRGT